MSDQNNNLTQPESLEDAQTLTNDELEAAASGLVLPKSADQPRVSTFDDFFLPTMDEDLERVSRPKPQANEFY